MAFGPDRSATVTLRANVASYVSNIGKASATTKAFGQQTLTASQKHSSALNTLGKTSLLFGGAIALGVGAAVNAFAEFDQQLSNVRSVSGATASQMKLLSDAALKAGADTKFSATDAAAAEAELAKVGISVNDILGGALLGSLNLAAAGNLDLADAATIAGQAMKIFKLQGSDVGHVADVLAAGANASAADVTDLAAALRQGGLVAAQTGLSLDDTAGVLSAFADNALIGSDAGTSFKTMLQRLTPQSDQAAALMDKLGLSAFDASGEFIGISKYAGLLQQKLGAMSTEQRNATLQTLFGSDAIRAATVLYGLGAEGVDKYVATVNDQGAAARTAAIQMDNLRGDLEQLKGSIDTALIKGGSAANSSLRTLTKSATALVNAFGGLPGPVQKGALAMAALASASLLAGGAVSFLAGRAASTQAAIVSLGITSEATAAKIGLLAKSAGVLAAAAVAIGVAGIAADHALGVVQINTDKAGASLLAYSKSGADAAGVTRNMSFGFKNLGDALNSSLDTGKWAKTKEFFADFGTLSIMPTEHDDFVEFLKNTDAGLANLAQSGHADEAAAIFKRIATEAVSQGHSVAEVNKLLPQYNAAVTATAQASKQADEASKSLGGAVDGVEVSVEDATKAVDDLVQSLAAAGLVQLSARDAARALVKATDAVDEAIKANGTSLDIHNAKSAKARERAIANQEALDGQAKASIAAAQAVYEQVKQTQGAEPAEKAFQGALLRSRASLIESARKFGLSETAAKKYADKVLNIPAVKNTKVTLTGTDAAISDLEKLRRKMLEIRDKHVSVSVTVGTTNKLAGSPALDPSRNAAGGYIRGPGTTTSDSIPSLLSDREYVVKAAAVAKYGVSFFDRLNSMRFSGGGLATRAAPAPAAAPSSGGVPGIVYNGPVYTEDPTTFARAQVRSQRDAVTMYQLKGA